MYPHYSRIVLRKIEKRDLKDLSDLKNESWWGTHSCLIANSEDQLRWYESIPEDCLVMIAENNSQPIGVAIYSEINYVDRSLNISGSIYPQFRKDVNKVKDAFAAGLDFAFEILNMFRVEAEVLESNVPAQQLEIGYLGFVVEGIRRKAVYKSGKYYNSVMLGILRDEWEQCLRVSERLNGETGSCNHLVNHTTAHRMCERFNREFHKPSCN